MGQTASFTMEGQQTGPEAPEESQGQQGDLLAGKYTSEEELEKGTLELIKKQANGDLSTFYKKLESGEIKLGEEQAAGNEQTGEDQGDQGDQQKTDENQQNSDTPESREETKNVLEQNGLKLEDFEQEFAQNGELSEESYNKLSELFPKSMIDTYIEGQKALAERTTNELMDMAGGQENYNEMVQWASENLSEEEINYFNNALQSGDMTQAKFAVSGLTARYQSATGKSSQQNQKPNLVQGQSPSQSQASGYQSKQEMVRDMQDPKYESDPAFRTQVEEKLRRTTAF